MGEEEEEVGGRHHGEAEPEDESAVKVPMVVPSGDDGVESHRKERRQEDEQGNGDSFADRSLLHRLLSLTVFAAGRPSDKNGRDPRKFPRSSFC